MIQCPHCTSSSVQKRGIRRNKRKYQCNICKKWFSEALELSKKNNYLHRKLPRITLLDIETLPMKVYTWGMWDQNIGINQIIRDWCILSWSAKRLFDSRIDSAIMTSKEAIAGDDKRITESLWKIVDESDIVIAHNANGFDIKKMNVRFLVHNMPPPRANQIIDTLEVIKKNFGMTCNKLDFIAQLLVNDKKIKTDFDLWSDCYEGKAEALEKMLDYNKHDVEVLEEVYLKIRPWMKGHPNLGLYSDDNQETCPNCGSINLVENGHYYTCANRYVSLRCEECGALSRERLGDLDKEKKQVLLRN